MTILKRLLTTVLFIACIPFILAIVCILGPWAIWMKPAEVKQEAPKSADVPAGSNPSITAPINWNKVPIGHEDKGGTC